MLFIGVPLAFLSFYQSWTGAIFMGAFCHAPMWPGALLLGPFLQCSMRQGVHYFMWLCGTHQCTKESIFMEALCHAPMQHIVHFLWLLCDRPMRDGVHFHEALCHAPMRVGVHLLGAFVPRTKASLSPFSWGLCAKRQCVKKYMFTVAPNPLRLLFGCALAVHRR